MLIVVIYALGLVSRFDSSLSFTNFTKFRFFVLPFLSFGAYLLLIHVLRAKPILWMLLSWNFGLSMSYVSWTQQWGNALLNTELWKAKIKYNYCVWYVCSTWYCFHVEMSMLQSQLGGCYYGDYPWSTFLGDICNWLFPLDLIVIGKSSIVMKIACCLLRMPKFLLSTGFSTAKLISKSLDLAIMWDILYTWTLGV